VRVVYGGVAAPPRRQETTAAAAFERRQDMRGPAQFQRPRREEYDTRPPQGQASHDGEMLELVIELDRVERERRMPYIVLKWFRDTALPSSGLRWTEDPDFRRDVLRDAIDSGLVVTAKVPNPYNPAFPPTTLRVNREHDRVRRVLPPMTDEPEGGHAARDAEPAREAQSQADAEPQSGQELHPDPA